MPDSTIPSPGTVLEDLMILQGELRSIDDRRDLILQEIRRLKGRLLPCIADGAELTLAFGYHPVRKYLHVSRTGEQLDVRPLTVTHTFDLEWPSIDADAPVGPGPDAPSYTVPAGDEDADAVAEAKAVYDQCDTFGSAAWPYDGADNYGMTEPFDPVPPNADSYPYDESLAVAGVEVRDDDGDDL